MPCLQKTILNMVCNKKRISCFENSQDFSSVLQIYPSIRSSSALFSRMERKTAAGIAAAVRTTATAMLPQPPKKAATGPIFPWPCILNGHGAETHPWPLRLSICAARGTSTDQPNGTDGYATRRFIAHPYQSSRAAAVAELRAAKEWIDRVRRRKRLRCRSPGALTAGAHPRW